MANSGELARIAIEFPSILTIFPLPNCALQVPQGRKVLADGHQATPAVPPGLVILRAFNPALKGWAIFNPAKHVLGGAHPCPSVKSVS